MTHKQESRQVRRGTDSFVRAIYSENSSKICSRLTRAVSRFQAIVRQDGFVAATHRVARKIGRKLGRYGFFRNLGSVPIAAAISPHQRNANRTMPGSG